MCIRDSYIRRQFSDDMTKAEISDVVYKKLYGEAALQRLLDAEEAAIAGWEESMWTAYIEGVNTKYGTSLKANTSARIALDEDSSTERIIELKEDQISISQPYDPVAKITKPPNIVTKQEIIAKGKAKAAKAAKAERKIKMQSEALTEYIRALEHRFIPFRRYHYLSSDQDIVHNGIINSEHNVVNAVDVIYMNPALDGFQPKGSQQIKASSFIPDEMINM